MDDLLQYGATGELLLVVKIVFWLVVLLTPAFTVYLFGIRKSYWKKAPSLTEMAGKAVADPIPERRSQKDREDKRTAA